MSGLEINKDSGLFSVLGSGDHGPAYLSVKSELLAGKYFTVGRGGVVVPLKGTSRMCLLPGAPLDVHRGTQDTKGGPFQKAQHLGMTSALGPTLFPHPCCYVLYVFLFYISLFLQINPSFTSSILNFSFLFSHVSSMHLGCSTLQLRDKLLAKGMGKEVQILS